MIDTDKWIESARVSLSESDKWIESARVSLGKLEKEVKRLREALRIERRIVQAFYDYRDTRCYEDCETWMLEKGHRVMVKYGNEEQSEWKVMIE